jgi:cell wall assembly regulator SMI1
MWQELIEQQTSTAEFGAPASEEALVSAAAELGHSLPADLVSVLLESDGVIGEYGDHLVMPVAEIVRRNLELRSSFALLYMSFDQLLFFSDIPGNGDLFALVLVPEQGGQVFVWEHETDSRTWVASSLGQFLEWWLTGKLQERLGW